MFRFHNASIQALKQEFGMTMACQAKRTLAVDGNVVIRLRGSTPDVDEELQKIWGYDEKYFHLSDLCSSPWEIMVDELRPCSPEEID